GTALWTFSNIRFNAVMGGLLAVWMGVSFICSETLLPVMISYFRPGFILREGGRRRGARWSRRRPRRSAREAAMTLWESVIIVTVFSIAVIVMDEIIHARRRKRREREGAARVGH